MGILIQLCRKILPYFTCFIKKNKVSSWIFHDIWNAITLFLVRILWQNFLIINKEVSHNTTGVFVLINLSQRFPTPVAHNLPHKPGLTNCQRSVLVVFTLFGSWWSLFDCCLASMLQYFSSHLNEFGTNKNFYSDKTSKFYS